MYVIVSSFYDWYFYILILSILLINIKFADELLMLLQCVLGTFTCLALPFGTCIHVYLFTPYLTRIS